MEKETKLKCPKCKEGNLIPTGVYSNPIASTEGTDDSYPKARFREFKCEKYGEEILENNAS